MAIYQDQLSCINGRNPQKRHLLLDQLQPTLQGLFSTIFRQLNILQMRICLLYFWMQCFGILFARICSKQRRRGISNYQRARKPSWGKATHVRLFMWKRRQNDRDGLWAWLSKNFLMLQKMYQFIPSSSLYLSFWICFFHAFHLFKLKDF